MSVRSSLGSQFGKMPEVKSKSTGFLSVVNDPRLTIEERFQVFGLSQGVSLPPFSKEAKTRKKEFQAKNKAPPTGPKETGFFASHGISFPIKQKIGLIRDTAVRIKEQNKKQREAEIKSNPNLSNKILRAPDVKKTNSVKKTFGRFAKSLPRLGKSKKSRRRK